MANELTALGTFNGVEIKVRPTDQYIDVTAMCQANGKEWKRYARLESAKRFQAGLSSRGQNVDPNGLVVQIGDGPVEQRHTFAHRRIALHCAAWISGEFEQWVYEKIDQLVTTGRVELAPANPLRALRLMVDAMEDHERRLEAVESRIGVMELTREEAVSELRTVERAESSALPMTTRDKINQLVRAYCKATAAAHAEVWIRLYKELFYRCHFNAQLRARNAEKSALDCVEEAGLMSDLYAVASELLKF